MSNGNSFKQSLRIGCIACFGQALDLVHFKLLIIGNFIHEIVDTLERVGVLTVVHVHKITVVVGFVTLGCLELIIDD